MIHCSQGDVCHPGPLFGHKWCRPASQTPSLLWPGSRRPGDCTACWDGSATSSPLQAPGVPGRLPLPPWPCESPSQHWSYRATGRWSPPHWTETSPQAKPGASCGRRAPRSWRTQWAEGRGHMSSHRHSSPLGLGQKAHTYPRAAVATRQSLATVATEAHRWGPGTTCHCQGHLRPTPTEFMGLLRRGGSSGSPRLPGPAKQPG